MYRASIDRVDAERYNQLELAAPPHFVALGLAVALCACGPRFAGPWQGLEHAKAPAPDLKLQRCEDAPPCALRFVSPAGASFELPATGPWSSCAVWLDAGGAWHSKVPQNPRLELWLGELPGQRCETLADRPPTPQTPRWMLLDHPVESARSGMGTVEPLFTLSRQSQRVQNALITGQVDGVIALGQGETEFVRDLERATIRSGRQWLKREVFHLIFGENPDLAPAQRSIAARSHRPDLWQPRQDGLHLEVQGLTQDAPQLSWRFVKAREEATLQTPRLAPLKHPLRRRAAVEPCRDCGPRRDALR